MRRVLPVIRRIVLRHRRNILIRHKRRTNPRRRWIPKPRHIRHATTVNRLTRLRLPPNPQAIRAMRKRALTQDRTHLKTRPEPQTDAVGNLVAERATILPRVLLEQQQRDPNRPSPASNLRK